MTTGKANISHSDDYHRLVTIIIGPVSRRLRVTWPFKLFCRRSLFFRSVCMPGIPIVPDTTPPYIRILRQQFTSTATIPFPYATKEQCGAFSIFLSWNTHGEIKQSRQFLGVTSNDLTTRFNQYNELWNQMIECYKLSQFLVAPQFSNIIIDTMLAALREEASFQSRRRRHEDDDCFHKCRGEQEYTALMRNLQVMMESEHGKINRHAATWLSNGIPAFSEWVALGNMARKDILRCPTLPPDTRHVLGATSKQISVLYSDTNPKSPLRRMIIDMIVSYSMRYPKYYGQNGGFGELLGGSNSTLIEKFEVPMQFVQDLLAQYTKGMKESRLERNVKNDSCKYHEHKHGITCGRPKAGTAQPPAATTENDLSMPL